MVLNIFQHLMPLQLCFVRNFSQLLPKRIGNEAFEQLAIISTVFISARADKDYRPVSLAVMAALLCVTAWLTFRVGLGLPLTLARWPF